MQGKGTIYLVDDEEAVRASTGVLLETAGYAVRPYASGVAFLRIAGSAPPGCVLLDVRMPEMDGLQVQQALNARGIRLPVIVLTGHGDIATAVAAMKAGAVDFIEKPVDRPTLLGALATAFAQLARAGGGRTPERRAREQVAGLTRRENQVLRGMVHGRANKLIAFDLGISPRTVEVHRSNLMSKLGVRSLSEALRIAFAAGVDGDDA